MSIKADIESVFTTLDRVIAALESERDRLWAVSDVEKSKGGDWVPTNHAGNDCDTAASHTRSYVDYLKSGIGYVPAMLVKHADRLWGMGVGINGVDPPG